MTDEYMVEHTQCKQYGIVDPGRVRCPSQTSLGSKTAAILGGVSSRQETVHFLKRRQSAAEGSPLLSETGSCAAAIWAWADAVMQEVMFISRCMDCFGGRREIWHENGGLVGSCVCVPQAWNGPKQGSSGAKTFREDVLFVLVAGSSSHVFENTGEAVQVGGGGLNMKLGQSCKLKLVLPSEVGTW